jgi:hypothetical protein
MKPSIVSFLRSLTVGVCLLGIAQAAVAQSAQTTQVTLALQESKATGVDELHMQFVGYRDTRCPSNVVCGIAGEAQALLWISGPRLPGRVVVLPWSGSAIEFDQKRAVPVGKLQLQLLSLEPRPLMGQPIDPAQYKAVVAFRSQQLAGKKPK